MFATTGNSITKRLSVLACVAIATAALAGCSGSDGAAGAPGAAGPAGPAGPSGPQGPTGSVTALDIKTARLIKGTITGVSGTPSQPTVAFKLEDEFGTPLKGLQASTIRFGAVKLVPGANGGSNQWVSYINNNAAPTQATTPVASWGTTAQRQATAEAASTTGAVFTDNGNGTYTYKFAKDFGAYTAANSPGPGPAIAFDGALTHRIGFEIRGTGLNAINNPVYTYVPATGATTSLPLQYDVVNTTECSACHDKLAFHGGPRTDVQYCVVCHNPGTIDPQSGNSVDMKVMVHKIHMGNKLPSVVAAGNTDPAAGKGYTIWGNSLSYWNYNGIAFTQDVRNCTTCHRESDATTPQASNWRTTVNSEACGTCHDNINFQTGVGHGGIGATDADCATCHGPNSTTSNGALRVAEAHRMPAIEAARKFKYQVVRVENTAPGQFPLVTIKVTDPTNADTPYVINQAGGPYTFSNSSLRVDVAFSVAPDFTNVGSGSAGATTGTPAQPIAIDFKTGATQNADGSYTKAATVAIPATATGSGSAILEGRPVVAVDGVNTQLAVQAAGLGFRITDTTLRARRTPVAIGKCNDCHKQLSLHGNNRTDNTELCATCHNPNATDVNRRVPTSTGTTPGTANSCVGVGGPNDETIDLKVMVHAIHAGAIRGAGNEYKVCGFNNTGYDFSHVTYPGDLANCEGCHNANGYYPSTTLIPVTTGAGADRSTATDDVATTGNSAACAACHTGGVAKLHMEQNGGVFDTAAIKNADGTSVNNVETCVLCHGPGRSSDVKSVHGVGDFKFN